MEKSPTTYALQYALMEKYGKSSLIYHTHLTRFFELTIYEVIQSW